MRFIFTNNSVADINQSLIDDGLVDKEKIGGSNYFWSFPAKKDRQMQLQYEKTLEEIERLKTAVDEANAALLDAKRGREDEDEAASDAKGGDGTDGGDESAPPAKKQKTLPRAEKLERLNSITKETAALEAELERLKENDPQALADLEKELDLVKQAANRWTDNIFNCKAYLVKKRGMDKKDACKLLGIAAAFDCTFVAQLCPYF
jgi:Leucine zipper with capping helix domain/Mnd1 HTH domain